MSDSQESRDLDGFHAAQDRQVVRNEVLAAIGRLDGVELHAVVGQKSDVSVHRQTPEASTPCSRRS